MPTYDYKCNDCNYTFEMFQKMTDEPLDKCPKCSGNLKRLIGTGATPIFKGSGFYQTDYKNSSPLKTESKTENKSISETKKDVKKD
jgi:putative FmdB family regulatory protein